MVQTVAQDNEILMQKFKVVAAAIERYRQGREIILLGDHALFRQFLRKEFGVTKVTVLTLVKKKAVNGVVFIGDIKGMKDKYFIVVPTLKRDLDLQFRLYDCGYEELKDCFFINHGRIDIAKGTKNYTDDYGNHVNAPSCDVILSDYVFNVDIDVDESCRFGKDTAIIAERYGDAVVRIGRGCVFEEGFVLNLYGGAHVTIGEQGVFNRNTEMYALDGMTLRIGRDCLFSCDIKVYCGDGHAIYDLRENKHLNPLTAHSPKNLIDIGDHVWAGMRAVILNRSVVGTSSIIGAGSLVKGEFPNNCLIAGTPARIVRRDITWSANPRPDTMDHIPEEYRHFTEDEQA